MSIWTGQLLPAMLDAFLFSCEMVQAPRQYRLVEHAPLGRVGGTTELLGATGRVYHVRAVFTDQEFQNHKTFVAMCERAASTGVPLTLSHPVYGVLSVYPATDSPEVTFDRLSATVTATFKRVMELPASTAAGAVFFAEPFPPATISANCAGYLSALAWSAFWTSQWLQAALTLIRCVTQLPVWIERGLNQAAAAIVDYIEGFGQVYARQVEPDPATGETAAPPDAGVRAALRLVDAGRESYLYEANISAELIDAIAADTTTYTAGIYQAGEPDDLATASPSPRFHAALTMVALWETINGGLIAAALARELARRSREQTLAPGAATAAVDAMRARLARASRLAGAAFGLYAPPMQREIATQAAQLLRILRQVNDTYRATRTYTITNEKPLLHIALELSGDVGSVDAYAAKIRRLNPTVRQDFNRLPIGSAIEVPA